MKILIQMGWRKTLKEGQVISVKYNNDPVNWEHFPGKWLTPQTDRSYQMWHLCELDAEKGDLISIECKTGIPKKGLDEDRTFKLNYAVGDKTTEVFEKRIPGVGISKYPLIKGRLIELSEVSQTTIREQDIEDFLEKGF